MTLLVSGTPPRDWRVLWWRSPSAVFSPVALLWFIHAAWVALLAVDLVDCSASRSALFRIARSFLYLAMILLLLAKALAVTVMASL
ncbi:MAG: hypothetical protein KY475_09815 [Planctomycetes bacterium]|nr:hypothetical protein [Planctomycetota bacterium]